MFELEWSSTNAPKMDFLVTPRLAWEMTIFRWEMTIFRPFFWFFSLGQKCKMQMLRNLQCFTTTKQRMAEKGCGPSLDTVWYGLGPPWASAQQWGGWTYLGLNFRKNTRQGPEAFACVSQVLKQVAHNMLEEYLFLWLHPAFGFHLSGCEGVAEKAQESASSGCDPWRHSQDWTACCSITFSVPSRLSGIWIVLCSTCCQAALLILVPGRPQLENLTFCMYFTHIFPCFCMCMCVCMAALIVSPQYHMCIYMA